MNYYLASDIHGNLDAFVELLKDWKNNEILIINGDCLDRGPKSSEVYELIENIRDYYPDELVTIIGNHELMFAEFIEKCKDSFSYVFENYWYQGGKETLVSMHRESHPRLKDVLDNMTGDTFAEIYFQRELYSNFETYVKNSKPFYEHENFIVVHAGINFDSEDWRKAEILELAWIRTDFYLHSNPEKVNKNIYFGHTPIFLLPEYLEKLDSKLGHWNRKNLYGIDGGAAYALKKKEAWQKAYLLGIRVNSEGIPYESNMVEIK